MEALNTPRVRPDGPFWNVPPTPVDTATSGPIVVEMVGVTYIDPPSRADSERIAAAEQKRRRKEARRIIMLDEHEVRETLASSDKLKRSLRQ